MDKVRKLRKGKKKVESHTVQSDKFFVNDDSDD